MRADLGTQVHSMGEKLPDIWQAPAEAIGEMLLDKKLEATYPALSQIPLLSLAIAAYKSKSAISDYLLARKVQQFYAAWEHLNESDRRKIYYKFQKKPRAFVEKLLLSLEQQEDMEKCRLLGALTAAYLQGNLKRAEYLDAIETVTHLSLRDLLKLATLLDYSLIFAESELGERYVTLFLTRGLIVRASRIPSEQRTATDDSYFQITGFGTFFAEQASLCKLKEVA